TRQGNRVKKEWLRSNLAQSEAVARPHPPGAIAKISHQRYHFALFPQAAPLPVVIFAPTKIIWSHPP
ncbi:MAG: hypothetical protein M0R02_16365, partial [Bacteroidales bacterium]|nr:hypothetical protein [Bacteroidales bacterium]